MFQWLREEKKREIEIKNHFKMAMSTHYKMAMSTHYKMCQQDARQFDNSILMI